MIDDPRRQAAPLRIVGGRDRPQSPMDPRRASADGDISSIPDVDWTILMARAQDGDGTAYLRLLQEVTPYLRALAARRYREPQDVEDAVQDVLLTVHAIRQTFDPARPFGPWLVAIANRRFIDRLRRQGRLRARETPLTTEHETFADGTANLEERTDRHGLEGAIDNLPPMQKQAIELLKLKEMSLKEAASVSGVSVASLKVATHRALRSLRRMLSERNDGGRR
ncbi:RNA polymerase sigma factor (sigma-70 family) [Mesorhizobium soli]|uniref:sigma-70 family RNA polymerase sigma factor n=1 Tax=Pseudaminobacter soli (ex Li et al. 2025) TaxID=1295366 RepID=UPI0024737FF6|nr:sigma-70 family RNA polymerase sigma factor [Mesorhizobium soli]MDH6230757.1 RNA polymerase sigma factor (sigma-70 family) [Mesorhizobium soli]